MTRRLTQAWARHFGAGGRDERRWLPVILCHPLRTKRNEGMPKSVSSVTLPSGVESLFTHSLRAAPTGVDVTDNNGGCNGKGKGYYWWWKASKGKDV